MATTLPAASTQQARSGAQTELPFDHVRRIGRPSRIGDGDIEILQMNLVQLYDGRYEARSTAWDRLESAWKTVRPEGADDSASSPLTEVVSPANGAAVAAAEVDAPMAVVATVPLALRSLNWVTGVLGPAISSKARRVVRWSREPARRAELGAAAMRVRGFVSSAALAGAKHASHGWCGLQGVVARLKGKWQTWKAARSQSTEIEASAGAIEFHSLAGHATGLLPPRDAPTADLPTTGSHLATFARNVGPADVAHRSNGSTNLAQGLATSTMRQLDQPTTSSPDTAFVLMPLPWVLSALSPVISSRTLRMHHGDHYARCIESANRLARDHKKLAGKNPLEIVRWAREHARGTELLTTASEAWNHSLYWQCLTPQKKRPNGELGTALYRMFGDFSNFADKFALAGATHVGSGWLWLIANSRGQVRILTTSDADCPEARGHTCLLAIDVWEHAYYLDHQNRRREYLDALIDRRLDWDFAEQRYRLVLQRETQARRKPASRAGDGKRSHHPKRQRKAATSRP